MPSNDATRTEADNSEDESTRDSDNAATEKTLTQKDFDRAMKRRMDRLEKSFNKKLDEARSSAISEWREEMGITDEALKQFGESRSVEAQAKSDIRKLKGDHTKLKNAYEALESRYGDANNKLRDWLIRKELLTEAAAVLVDPEDAVDKLSHMFRYDEDNHEVFVVDEKGEPSGQTAKDLVRDLAERKKHLAKPIGEDGAGSRVSPAPTTKTKQQIPSTEERLSVWKGLYSD